MAVAEAVQEGLSQLGRSSLSSGSLLRYSVSAATLTALSYHVYREYNTKKTTGQSWKELARERQRNAAAVFCGYVQAFQHGLRTAREHLHAGRVDEAIAVLTGCLQQWQFRKQTLRALKRHLHPELFARLVSSLVERRLCDCQDVLSHLSAAAPRPPASRVGLNMDLQPPSDTAGRAYQPPAGLP
ncbi:uncharacterized protein LOC129599749 [Paramacrobiotus metropolitanus]|uniref:uncharacterized protein LOC129599749 n=1 Tax=Paramacrobiotus metropolitanus TaxID=2943436 RepID=UPI0024456CBD|nr:uncharacterized protein LOC129599749 [Paramacrobiotus metropolitanus]